MTAAATANARRGNDAGREFELQQAGPHPDGFTGRSRLDVAMLE